MVTDIFYVRFCSRFDKVSAALLRLGILFVLFILTSITYAAPHPATATSGLLAPEKGLFLKGRGFVLRTADSGWTLKAQEELTYAPANSDTASLLVRSEVLKADLTLEGYAKKWMRDYSSYGFEVLGTKGFVVNSQPGLVIDLDYKKTGEQLRQILFLKNKRVVILTCKDVKKTFEITLQGCNQIAKTFEWVPLTAPKAF